MPGPLAAGVRRVAKQRSLTMSHALVALAERGVHAELEARENLKAAYGRFMKEQEPARKGEVGKDLIRAIFRETRLPKVSFSLKASKERQISLADVGLLEEWVRSEPVASEGPWYKDFGSFKLCGSGEYPRTVLPKEMKAFGTEIE